MLWVWLHNDIKREQLPVVNYYKLCRRVSGCSEQLPTVMSKSASSQWKQETIESSSERLSILVVVKITSLIPTSYSYEPS